MAWANAVTCCVRTSVSTPHIEDVASVLFYEDLNDVILVGHSYGGMVITGVADRAIGRVPQLVYLDAAIPMDGEALVDVSPGLQAFRDVRIVDGVELGLWPHATAAALYGINDPKLAEWALPRLTPHPWKSFEQPLALANADAVAALPRGSSTALIRSAAVPLRR